LLAKRQSLWTVVAAIWISVAATAFCSAQSLDAHSAVARAAAQTKATPRDASSRVMGVWAGESVCVPRGTACNDEDAIYRITRREGTPPGWVSVDGGKIVDGRAVSMGTLDCKYDANKTDATKASLRCEYARGVWQFTVSGDKMQGTLTLPDKTVLRRVSLTKQEGTNDAR
jgi:hypothetical protein